MNSGTPSVRDVMSRDVVSGALDTPYADIADLQTRHRLNAVPVLDDLHWLAGVVSEGDLLRRVRSTSPSGPSSTTPRSGTSTRGALSPTPAEGKALARAPAQAKPVPTTREPHPPQPE
ncbi:CBS domain-containing protein [Catellatospora bangladeshensis]|uniref:CBS domain-containing protein n=1 Tax=Catellatospora bangladeshensis TaxID=310355 RepID=A0A8J3JT14_9ACTN|nr:CBS domain-containing protein [Catellatospora bangladeshensis]GIF84615.1 hypothetical protein Cba03nite_59640 [Catellatospora bangladeshensis]